MDARTEPTLQPVWTDKRLILSIVGKSGRHVTSSYWSHFSEAACKPKPRKQPPSKTLARDPSISAASSLDRDKQGSCCASFVFLGSIDEAESSLTNGARGCFFTAKKAKPLSSHPLWRELRTVAPMSRTHMSVCFVPVRVTGRAAAR